MTCKQCKYITVCMAQADGLGQVFDPNYDGEHGCTDFVPFTNADRIRAMSDEELAAFIVDEVLCIKRDWMRETAHPAWVNWLQQPTTSEANS